MRSVITNAVSAFVFVKVLSDLLAGWLSKDKQERVRGLWQRLQSQWEKDGVEKVVESAVGWLNSTFDEVFGQRPFSRHSFTRCLIIGPLLLGACLGVYGLWLKLPFAMHNLPWESYRESLEILKKAAADPKTKAGAESVWQNLRDLSQLHGWTYEAIYTIYFLLVVIAVITVLLWLNLGISRLFLREIAGTKTLFAGLVLTITNTIFVLIMGMSASLMLFILTNVWTWPFASVPLAVSSWSVLLGGGMAAGVSILLWLVAEPWLRVVVILSLLPLFLTVAAVATACVGVVFRNQINSVVSKVLNAGLHSPKGVLSFIGATANFTAFVLASLVIAIAWVTNLSFQLSTQPIFGFDLISTSVVVLVVSAAVTILSQSSGPRPVMTFGEAALTFLVACVTIDAGFYIEAITVCFFRPDELARQGSSFVYLVPLSGVIPAAVVGGVATLAKGKKDSVFRVGIKIVACLVALDVFNSLRTLDTYRNLCFSIACDVIGGFIAGAIIMKYTDVLKFISHKLSPRQKENPPPT